MEKENRKFLLFMFILELLNTEEMKSSSNIETLKEYLIDDKNFILSINTKIISRLSFVKWIETVKNNSYKEYIEGEILNSEIKKYILNWKNQDLYPEDFYRMNSKKLLWEMLWDIWIFNKNFHKTHMKIALWEPNENDDRLSPFVYLWKIKFFTIEEFSPYKNALINLSEVGSDYLNEDLIIFRWDQIFFWKRSDYVEGLQFQLMKLIFEDDPLREIDWNICIERIYWKGESERVHVWNGLENLIKKVNKKISELWSKCKIHYSNSNYIILKEPKRTLPEPL